jgi:3-oxoacyl-[acyl-carrier-protein] synthase III
MNTWHAYINSIGSYLPGPPITNDEMEQILGMVGNHPSRLRSRILKSNGILTRHYAMDSQQHSTHQNCELAAEAVKACIDQSSIDYKHIDMLAVATTQGDLPLPGLASMVQAELSLPPCEILTTHGVCSAGVMALKSAVNQVRLGEKQNAVVCASELASRLLKKGRYEAASPDNLGLESEFLRWMLSDGAAAALVQSKPRSRGVSLRIDWIELISHSANYDLCMSCGTADQSGWSNNLDAVPQEASASARNRTLTSTLTATKPRLQDYDTYAEAEIAGALVLRQNLKILDNIVKVGVEGFLRLVNAGKISPSEIDHLLCHYSSHYFRGKIADLLTMAGVMVREEAWFTNLYSKGNTGCASIFIMLDELFWSGRLQPGQTVFCVVPESGRFTTAYIKMTVV